MSRESGVVETGARRGDVFVCVLPLYVISLQIDVHTRALNRRRFNRLDDDDGVVALRPSRPEPAKLTAETS